MPQVESTEATTLLLRTHNENPLELIFYVLILLRFFSNIIILNSGVKCNDNLFLIIINLIKMQKLFPV